MGKRKIVSSISLNSDIYESISAYAKEYFQGNISGALAFMAIKYLKYEDNINKLLNGNIQFNKPEDNKEINIPSHKEDKERREFKNKILSGFMNNVKEH